MVTLCLSLECSKKSRDRYHISITASFLATATTATTTLPYSRLPFRKGTGGGCRCQNRAPVVYRLCRHGEFNSDEALVAAASYRETTQPWRSCVAKAHPPHWAHAGKGGCAVSHQCRPHQRWRQPIAGEGGERQTVARSPLSLQLRPSRCSGTWRLAQRQSMPRMHALTTARGLKDTTGCNNGQL